jgi:hypothetical protein
MYIINVIADDETTIGIMRYIFNVTHFQRSPVFDGLFHVIESHYFDRFICQRLYYDAEIA